MSALKFTIPFNMPRTNAAGGFPVETSTLSRENERNDFRKSTSRDDG